MKTVMLLCFCLAVFLYPVSAMANDITCQLSTTQLDVGLNIAKERIKISGESPVGAPVFIIIQGPNRPALVSMYKNKGLLKLSEAEVMNLPGFFHILSSVPIEQIEPSHLAAMNVYPDYQKLRSMAWVRMRQDIGNISHEAQKDYIGLAIKTKEEKNLFALHQEVVNRSGENYWVEVPLVAGMPIGELSVKTFSIVDERVVASEPQIITLKPSSYLFFGSKELSISAFVVIVAFMVPIMLLSIAAIVDMVEQRRERERRTKLLKQIWQ
ncbi:hypothetical protein N752_09600 [Desulforamulus aquiferis]|nr:TIGR02186 family protein [Desulforamulus aquiferis]RYD05591.1 hypothetical protein N752_09600 [Desulforamulus aquiferis]